MDSSAVYVAAGCDRFEKVHQAFGLKPIDFKVATRDTDGRLFVVENGNSRRGGPPRHVHHGQEEFFYVLEGAYVIEVGERRFELGPGDAVLAARGVPHVWAYVGDGHGRLLITFQPAGRMEAFFEESSAYEAVPPPDELAALFARNGMTLLGPPLDVR